MSELHFQMVNNHSSIRELVLDGLPPSSIAMEEAELMFEALSTNTSIKRLSMRYSNVEHDLASLFALALVDNTNLTQLSLEGNRMTTVSAKNFYSVLTKNNDTLRLLDLSKNPLIDDDVEQALDQFMEQRALKRTLTNKAEKARRAARGMPPDATLDENDNDEGGGQVTVVCLQSTIDNVLLENSSSGGGDDEQDYNGYRQQEQQPQELANNDDASESLAKPYPGEDFRDYMQRMDEMKESTNQSPVRQRQLMDESMRERDVFDNFAAATGSEPLSGGQQQEQQQEQQYQFRRLQPLNSQPQNPPSPTGNDSTGSSITTRSTNKRGNVENDIITTSSNNPQPEPSKAASAAAAAASGVDRSRAPPARMNTIETQESANDGTLTKSPGRRRNSLETLESSDDHLFRDPMNDLQQQQQQQQMPIGSVPPDPYHNTQSSKGSDPTFEITQEDYMDDKAGERAMRRALATSGGAIGAYQIDEAAPSRQNRQGGARRGRVNRTESQRRARLAQLSGGDPAAVVGGARDGPGGNEDFMDADIERADDEMRPQLQRKRSKFYMIGLDDEDSGTDRIICGILVLLLFGLLVLVIILLV